MRIFAAGFLKEIYENMKKEYVYKSPVVKVVTLQFDSSLMMNSLASGYARINDWEWDETYDEADY